MQYDIYNEGKCTLAKQRNPKWKIKSHAFYLAFTADPREVLNYGPNGLHYSEHILFNLINDKGKYFDGNASTYDMGEMTFYFKGVPEDLVSNLTNFFKVLMSLTDKKTIRDYTSVLNREQRRVTTEVFVAFDSINVPFMFVKNPKMFKGEYPWQFVYNILMVSCRLEKVLIMVHDDMNVVPLFKELAKKFNDVWKAARMIEPLPEPLTSLGVFPPSRLDTGKSKAELALIDLSHIQNPIVRIGVLASIDMKNKSYNVTPYAFRAWVKGIPKDIKVIMPIYKPDNDSDQYFWSVVLLSSGSDVTSDMINDIINNKTDALIKKYDKEVKKELKALIDMYYKSYNV